MSGASTNRFLIVGESGSGKSRKASELIDGYRAEGKRPNVVMLQMGPAEGSELERHALAVVEIDDKAAAAPADYTRMIQAERRLLFEVTAVDSIEWLQRIGRACLDAGNALVVIDEAAELVTSKAPPEFLALWTRGRIRSVDIIAVCQSIKHRPAIGLNRVAVNRSTCLIAFQCSDSAELDELRRRFPATGDYLHRLQSPRDGGPPEFAVRDALTGREALYLRSGRYSPTTQEDPIHGDADHTPTA